MLRDEIAKAAYDWYYWLDATAPSWEDTNKKPFYNLADRILDRILEVIEEEARRT